MKAIFAESAVNPKVETGDRPRGRRARRPRAVGGRARPARAATARPTSARSRPTRARWPRASPAPDRPASSPVPDLSAPYIQRGIVEILLLAVLAGVLGTWVVLRRLPFFTHAIGTATFPGLVVAGPVGRARAAHRAGLRGRVRRRAGAPAALAPDRHGRRDRPAAGRRAGDRRGARQRRLPLGRERRPAAVRLADRADRRSISGSPRPPPSARWRWTARCGARGWRPASTPTAPARSACSTAAADRALLLAVAVAVVVALDAVGALLVTVVLTVPAATVRLFEPSLRTQQLATFGLAAVEGLVAIVVADALNVGPGPGARRARRARLRRGALTDGRRRWRSREGQRPRPARRLRPRRRRARRGGVRRRSRARSSRCSGPTAAARRRCSARCSGELPFRSGEVALDGRPAYVPQTEHARLDFPVSAHDVALMGAYGRTPWFERVSRARPRRRRTRRSRGSGSPTARTTASGRSPAASASGC